MIEPNLTYVTLHGIPLTFHLEWPFHPSSAGADYFVLHGNVALADGSGLQVDIAIHMSQAVKQALPSLDKKDAEAPAINAMRKATDTKDIEFLKSGKRQPIPLSSRAYNIVGKKFTFQNPSDEQLAAFLKRKVYWLSKLGALKVWLADPCDALYLTREPAQLVESAKTLVSSGFATLEGEYAVATTALMQQGKIIEAECQTALDEISAKHTFERG